MSIQKILVGYDGTTPAENALNLAIYLASLNKTELHFAFVIHEPSGMADPITDELYKSLQEAGNRILSDAVLQAREQFLEPFIHLENGNPRDKLFQLAETITPDLVVLGMTKHPASEKVIGTVSSQFLKSKKYPLLLVP